jgi:hypothetical protein
VASIGAPEPLPPDAAPSVLAATMPSPRVVRWSSTRRPDGHEQASPLRRSTAGCWLTAGGERPPGQAAVAKPGHLGVQVGADP